jgi:hypothetical protein
MNDPLGLFSSNFDKDPLGLFEKKPEKNFSLSNAIGFAGAGIGNMADTALSTLAGSVAALAGDKEAALSIDEEMRNRRAIRSKWYTDPSFAEKAVGIVGTLPAQMVGMGLSPAETALIAKDAGESNTNVLKAAATDAAFNTIGMVIPGFKQGSLAVRAGTGAAVNAGQDYASKLAIQQMLETEQGKQAFQPTLEDAALAGVIGGGLGAALGRSPTPSQRPTPAQMEADFKARAEKESRLTFAEKQARALQGAAGEGVIHVDSEGVGFRGLPDQGTLLAKEQQRIAMQAELDAMAKQTTDAETFRPTDGLDGQRALWDIDESVQARHPYQAEFGEWRVDENGIPIRADLSMEAQADQAPLQRDLFVDQNGEFAKYQDTGFYDNTGALVETPTKSMQQALDELGWAQKRGALKKSGLMYGDLEASGQLKAAAMEADTASPQARSGDPSLTPMQRWGKQAGAVNPEVFTEGFRKIKDLANGVRLYATGLGDRIAIEAVKNGEKIAGGEFKPTDFKDPAKAALFADVIVSDQKGTAPEIYKFASELGNDIVPSKIQTDSGKALWNKFQREGLAKGITRPYIPKSQRGSLLVKWGSDSNKAEVLQKLPGMKKALGAFVPEKLTVDEVIERAKTTGEKDVQQNILQRGANWFTKGALFQAQKTGNSFIAKTAQDWLQADRTSRGQIQQYIHDETAPAFRAMSNDEAATVGNLLNLADKFQEKITPEMMDKYGFSEKQKAAVDSHQRLMDKAFTAINEARAAAGKDPIDRRTAYAAMRAEGDFKRLVYKLNEKGEKEVVGVIGSNFSTKGAMGALRKDSTMKFIKDLEAKGYEVGEERSFRGFSNRNQGQLAFQQAMEHMAETNPATKEFLDVISQISQDNAYAFLNTKKHTLTKKGVFGMEGRKEWVSEYQNAKDLLESQLLYAENAFRWAEYSKAMQETKKLLSSDVDMPNAKQWIERYTNNAMGINPSVLGKNIEDTVNQAFTSMGIGPTAVQKGGAVARQTINTLLLGLNPGFLLTQMIQPSMALPALSSYLKTKGVGNTELLMADYFAWGVAAGTKKLLNSKNISALEAEAFDYAKKNSVYVTDLVDTSTKARKDVGYAFDKIGSFLSAPLEASTRSSVFMAYVKLLNDSGMSKADGLFETAHNLTDVTMVNYNKIERPMAFNSMGLIGDLGVNLQSFKFNELSKLSLFVREAAKDKSFSPILTQMATYIVAAGVMGIPGYQELESLYKEITKALSKPDSLTLRVLETQAELSKKLGVEDKKVMSHGVPSLMGVDLSKRLSMSNLAPDTMLDFMFPGASKLTAIAGAGYQLAKNPTDEMTQKNFVREALPIGVTGPLDRTWFEQDVEGGRAGINRTDLMRSTGASITPGPLRNEEDRFWKTLGMTGINESVQKDKLWQLKEQDMAYAELRSKALSKMIRKAYVSDSYAENIADYIAAQGDADTLERELSEKLKAGSISAITAAKIKAATAKTIPQMRGAQRTMEALGENE